MNLKIELEREDDGRWLAEVPELPGVMSYGKDRGDALAQVQALALRVLADRLEHGEAAPDLLSVTFKAA
jgi:predicted RNase H-like HicB family nuclease